MKGLEALCYLDDIAHGRKMKFDAHELKLIVEKELKAVEVVKPYIHIYCVAPNDRGGVRIWLTQDGKHYVDIPQEEYDLLKEVLL